MENKINIAELLKDCPEGMELDCTMYENLVFVEVDPEAQDYPITTKLKNGTLRWFTSDGRYELTNDAKCVIFPKGKTTWEGFHKPFKDGDIVATEHGLFIGIAKVKNNIQVNAYCAIDEHGSFAKNINYGFERFATEEEKEKLFQAIKDNGYIWDAETKTLENIEPKFKDGDVLFVDCSDDEYDKLYQFIFILKETGFYSQWHAYCYLDEVGKFSSKETYLTDDKYHPRFATEEEKAKLFKAIKDNGYKWNAETKTLEKLIQPIFKVGDEIKYKYPTIDTSTLTIITVEYDKNRYIVCDKPNNYNFLSFFAQDNFNVIRKTKFDTSTLVPFDSRVLVRDNDYDEWRGAFWGYLRQKADIKYDTTRGVYRQCIPYEGNEHLLGKTDDCDDFYKNWE